MIEIKSPIAANVWKVHVSVGQRVEEDEEVAILESMKMEIPVESSASGLVREVRVHEGGTVQQGQVMVVLDP